MWILPLAIGFSVIDSTYLETFCTNKEPRFGDFPLPISNDFPCKQIYDKPNCTGNSIRITPRSPSPSLEAWGFFHKTKSFGSCQESCVPEIGLEISPLKWKKNNTSLQDPITATFYFNKEHTGKAYPISVIGCTKIYEQPYYRKRFLSMEIPSGSCILAFMGGDINYALNHTEENMCHVPNSEIVLEIWDGVPYLHDLEMWYSNSSEFIKAVSPCLCNYNPFSDFLINSSSIKLFSESHYRGNSVEILLNFTGCKDFASDNQLAEWEAMAVSYLGNGSCVQVYREHNCLDSNPVILTSPVTNLRSIRLNNSISSIKTCDPKNEGVEEVASNSQSSFLTYLIIIVSVSVVVCGVLFIILIRVRRNAVDRLSANEIKEFLEGLMVADEVIIRNKVEYNPGTETENESQYTGISTELFAQSQPYNYELEISQNCLEFDAKCSIGEGQYGLVLKGTMKQENRVIPVAIKTTKPLSGASSLRMLLKEVKVMIYVGKHPRIVSLVGCCTTKLREGKFFIILEYCKNGSLDKFLRTCRPNSRFGEYIEGVKTDVQQPADSTNTSDCNVNKLDIKQLVTWSIEISEGMEYLALKKVIHGDLSARNILVLANKTTKISDFGLARKMYTYEHYIKKGNEALPWRWLAIESLKNMEFSTSSDVWSFGILLWEIFSLGEQPYPGLPLWTNNFIVNLEQGLRPTIPPFATAECFRIMSNCWEKVPKMRPSFLDLFTSLSQMLQDL